MKRAIAFVVCVGLLLSLESVVFAGAFSESEKENKVVASFVDDLIGDVMLETLQKTNPGAALNWEAQGKGEYSNDKRITYLAAADTGNGYYYIEVQLSWVNSSDRLLNKYKIVLNE